MKVIAFDTAKRKTGWAYKALDGRWETGVVCVADTGALVDVVKRAQAEGVTHAALEDCYLAKGNVATLKALAAAQGAISTVCKVAGLTVLKPIHAQTWQSAFGITGKRDDRKFGAQRVAHALGASRITDDEADAVCLCDYAERVGEQQELELRGPRGGKLRARKTTKKRTGKAKTKKGTKATCG